MWVFSSISSLALVYCSQRARASTSIGLSFHCLSGSWMRIMKRNCCSSSVIENQYLINTMPERTSMRSNSGTERKNSDDVGLVAEPHDAFDAGAVVPAAVEQHDFAAGRQVRGVALEIPLAPLAFIRRRQRGNAADARVEALGDPLDHAALAGGITAFEDHDDLLLVVRDPVLQLHQLALQPEQLLEIDAPVDALGAGVVGGLGQQLVEPVVVQLHFVFFIEAVGQIELDTLAKLF